MNVFESVRMAVKTIEANRLRSMLTVLGIVIGNASVIAMIEIGQATQRFTSAQLEALGVRTLFVVARPGDARRGIRQNTLVLADAEAIATQAPSVKEVAPQIKEPELMSYRSKAVQAMVIGTTPAFVFVQNYSVTQGHFFSPQDEKRNARVVVLGSQLAQELFGDWPAVGETMRLNNLSFRVIGVMGAKGTAAGNNQDEVAVIPVTTMANRLVGRTSPYGIGLQFISVLPRDDAASMEAAEFQITNLLRRRHQITGSSVDDFVVRNQKDALAVFSNVSGALTILLATIATISLFVGGIGIMNIMLVSVTERTQEIGLRKAIGASKIHILQLFLTEAVILSLLGGSIGTVLGAGATLLIGIYTPLKTGVSLGTITLAVGVSGSIGLIFGVLPAQRAARLDPIVALKSI